MADIFRLLTRSTSFAKGAGSTAATANANAGANSASNKNKSTPAPPPSSSSKKRKSDDALPKELDFFNSGNKRARGGDESSDEGGDEDEGGGVQLTKEKENLREELGLVEPPVLPEQDVKAILRQHKLMFTTLEHAEQEQGARKDKKKKKVLVQPLIEFRHLHRLSPRLHKNMRAWGYETPTEVQMGAIPVLLVGQNLICCAPTGSGKTLAFMLPVLDWLLAQGKDAGRGRVRAVVVAPTKELAGQIVNEGKKLAAGTGLRVSMLRKGAVGVRSEVLVSTPAALLNSLQSPDNRTDWTGVERLILDEADVLLDPLFREQTLPIWTHFKKAALVTGLFSATISSTTESLSRYHNTASTTRLIVGKKDTTTSAVSQKLTYTATEPGKLLALRQLLATKFRPPALIFVQTIARAQALLAELAYDLPAPGRIDTLHADLPAPARASVLARFLSGEVWALITTDLLARGIDFRGVSLVVNYDVPTSVSAYIHRVGRTGRNGRVGEAVTYYTREDVAHVRGIAAVVAQSQGEGGWLVDALPKVGKSVKARLKRRGVEGRSAARISTRSGYERQRADRRRGAVEGSKRRKKDAADVDDSDGGEEEFTGIVDTE